MHKCKYCGKEFDTHFQLGGHIVCCKKNPRSKERNLNLSKAMIKKKPYKLRCERCGKKYISIITPFIYHKNKKRYCSRSCANKRKLSNKTKEKISAGVKQSYIGRTHHNKGKSERSDLFIRLFGTRCFFCNFEAKKGQWTSIHKKDGEKHKLPCTWSIKDLKNIEADDYVRLCGTCHKSVHWCMKYLEMTWEEITEQFASVR